VESLDTSILNSAGKPLAAGPQSLHRRQKFNSIYVFGAA
jgi:hypothetical protein